MARDVVAVGAHDEGRGRGQGRGRRKPARRHRRPRAAARALSRARLAGEAGMATAEYAIATVAAAGFAGLLVVVLRSDEVRGLLAGIVRGVLSV